jgi:hypothetical protein
MGVWEYGASWMHSRAPRVAYSHTYLASVLCGTMSPVSRKKVRSLCVTPPMVYLGRATTPLPAATDNDDVRKVPSPA